MADSFDKLISDMREVERAGDVVFEPSLSDRLTALLAELEPHLLPTFGSGSVGASAGVQPDDPPPIYAELIGDEPAPGSDWVVIDPVRPVTGNGSDG